MSRVWQLQQAKNQLSELVEEALKHGPQTISRRGIETAVVLSIEEYRRLARPKTGLVEFFRSSPLMGVQLDLERSPDLAREVEL